MSSIASNIAAYYAQQNINSANNKATANIGRLSSGNKIVRAADDVAALSVGTALQTQVSTLKRALLNTSQASSLLQVADGALSKITSILQRQKAISVQANSGTLTANERGFLDQEFQNLADEIDRLTSQTNFNGIVLLDGTAGTTTAEFELNNAAVGNITEGGTYANALAVTANSWTALTADKDLIGGFGDFSAVFDFDGMSNTVFQVTIGGDTYVSSAVASTTALAAGTTLTFINATGGSFSFKTGTSPLSLTTQGQASAIADAFDEAFADVEIYQARQITNFAAPPAGDVLNALVSANVLVRSNDTDSNQANTAATFGTLGNISEFTVRSVTGDGQNDATISVVVNGSTYVLDNTTVTYTASNQIDVSMSAAARLVSVDDANDYIELNLTTVAADIDILTADDATTLKDSLDLAFGVVTNNPANGGLNFQVGTDTSDTISISLSDASTSILYGGVSLNVLTTAGAIIASDQLDQALATLTSQRADVGALQSRFDFAGSTLEVAIQNQDAARGTLLDTDIASEATDFATSQVILQAGISVLAQANLLPQNLLKLLG